MKKYIVFTGFVLLSLASMAQVKECRDKNCRLFNIQQERDRILFTNTRDKLLYAIGFYQADDGSWYTDYQSFAPVFPKSQEDVQNFQYSCQCIHAAKKNQKMTGKFVIF